MFQLQKFNGSGEAGATRLVLDLFLVTIQEPVTNWLICWLIPQPLTAVRAKSIKASASSATDDYERCSLR